MSAKFRNFGRSNLWTVIFTLVVIALIGAVIALAVKVSKIDKQETDKELNALSYEIGTLDSTDGGKEIASDYALRTDFLEAEKFGKIEIQQNAKITYYIFYYDTDKNFLCASDEMTENLTEMPLEHPLLGVENTYFRVVISIPTTENKVTIFNKGNYVKQLIVSMEQ